MRSSGGKKFASFAAAGHPKCETEPLLFRRIHLRGRFPVKADQSDASGDQ